MSHATRTTIAPWDLIMYNWIFNLSVVIMKRNLSKTLITAFAPDEEVFRAGRRLGKKDLHYKTQIKLNYHTLLKRRNVP